MTNMIDIKQNLNLVEQQISQTCQQYHRSRQEITLVAVSKTKPFTMIEQVYFAGQYDFGENYLQEALLKINALRHLPKITWHFIGPIQSNKTKQIAENFSWVQSIDRAKIASRLNEQRLGQDSALNVCIQVNISGEESKSGVAVNDVFPLAHHISGCENLTLRGLMAIPEKQISSESYHIMGELFAKLKDKYPQIDTLSLGMSGDLSPAIAAGSTLVRIGTAIFGEREYSAHTTDMNKG